MELGCDRVWAADHVRPCEPEDRVPERDESVLASEVLLKSRGSRMRMEAVDLADQPLRWPACIDSGDDSPAFTHPMLELRHREAGAVHESGEHRLERAVWREVAEHPIVQSAAQSTDPRAALPTVFVGHEVETTDGGPARDDCSLHRPSDNPGRHNGSEICERPIHGRQGDPGHPGDMVLRQSSRPVHNRPPNIRPSIMRHQDLDEGIGLRRKHPVQTRRGAV